MIIIIIYEILNLIQVKIAVSVQTSEGQCSAGINTGREIGRQFTFEEEIINFHLNYGVEWRKFS